VLVHAGHDDFDEVLQCPDVERRFVVVVVAPTG
jgi:hypothetical protein